MLGIFGFLFFLAAAALLGSFRLGTDCGGGSVETAVGGGGFGAVAPTSDIASAGIVAVVAVGADWGAPAAGGTGAVALDFGAASNAFLKRDGLEARGTITFGIGE